MPKGVYTRKKGKTKQPDYKYQTNRKRILMIKYGISPEDYDRMYTKQKGICPICGIHQSELNKKLSVDHNHITNKVRGLLCYSCNLGIGNLKVDDGKQLLENAIKYLKG